LGFDFAKIFYYEIAEFRACDINDTECQLKMSNFHSTRNP
jgi:hypothetical protein